MAQNIVQSVVRLQYAENGNFSQTPIALDAGSAYTYVNQFPTVSFDQTFNVIPGPTFTSIPLTNLANVDTIAVWNLSFQQLLAVNWNQTVIASTQWGGVGQQVVGTTYAGGFSSNTNAIAGNVINIKSILTGTTYTWTAVSSGATTFQFNIGGTPALTAAAVAAAINAQTTTTGISAVSFPLTSVTFSFLGGNTATATWAGSATIAAGSSFPVPTTMSTSFACGNIVGPRQCLLIPGGLFNGLNNTYGGINVAQPLTLTGLSALGLSARVAIVGGG